MPVHKQSIRKKPKKVFIYTNTDSIKEVKPERKKLYGVYYGMYDYRLGTFIKSRFETGYKIYATIKNARQWKKIIQKRYKDIIGYACYIKEM